MFKEGVVKLFTTAMQCLGKCGGMDITFFRHITANFNQYECDHMDKTILYFGDPKWNNVQIDEMIHFFGMVLKMSNDVRRIGACTEYFYDEILTHLAEDYSFNIKGFISWVKDVMTLPCFKQIHSTFHPKLHFTEKRDKCHQLYYAIY